MKALAIDEGKARVACCRRKDAVDGTYSPLSRPLFTST
jgi:hypothetical protein